MDNTKSDSDYELQLAALDREAEKREVRIEALRAASRITDGGTSYILDVAAVYAHWLETGKRDG